MDETTKSIISKITINYSQPIQIASGHQCSVFYDCKRLCPSDLARLAAEATGDLAEDAFDMAVGLAYQGIFFAAAIAGGRQVAILQHDSQLCGPAVSGKRVIVVDDVVHSGSRLLKAEKALKAQGANLIGFACIIDRSKGTFGASELPLWSAFQTEMI